MQEISRRRILRTGIGLGVMAGLVPPALADGATLPLTPSCGSDPTPRQTEGPYYLPSTPGRSDLIVDGPGPAFTLVGLVLTRNCQPVRRALVDLWHADALGAYDTRGYRFRGHQFTDDSGRFAFRTVLPGLYPGRTRHFHVKVQAAGGPVLTTQLYFPNEAENRRDRIYDQRLLMSLEHAAGGPTGRFDFVITT